MKGIVFTEFMEMAEARYGLEAVEIAIQRAPIQARKPPTPRLAITPTQS
jgi:hypothetical protein